MSDVAVRIEGVGKQYRIEHAHRPTMLRELLTEWSRRAVQGARTGVGWHGPGRTPDLFWALQDVSLEVTRGETIAIIGSNGAGKSTLLKILSRITEPTTGQAWIRGRVGSLLEVGTGFHPELTGRENTYLNGAILGMKRAEIDARFDAIVDFSGIERFIDTPVKRYSSGMYLRLAFAVAAHLEPEILIVDEVLAVGDASFQRKCIGRMADVAREGRTVLFVSHNIAAVQSLCRTAALLQDGRLVARGEVRDVVGAYLRTVEQGAKVQVRDRPDRRGRGEVTLTGVEISTPDGQSGVLITGWPARFTFELSGTRSGISVWFTLYDAQGQPISSFNSRAGNAADQRADTAGAGFVCEIPDLPLVPGLYRLNAAVYTHDELQDHLEGAALFEVVEGVLHGRPVGHNSGHGSVRLAHRWVLPQGSANG